MFGEMKCQLVMLILSVEVFHATADRRFQRKAPQSRISGLGLIWQVQGNIRLTQCALACQIRRDCVGFNYGSTSTNNRECQLSGTKASASVVVNDPNFNYYEDDESFVPNQSYENNENKISAETTEITFNDEEETNVEILDDDALTKKEDDVSVDAPDDDYVDPNFQLYHNVTQCPDKIPSYCNGRGNVYFNSSCGFDHCYCKSYYRGVNCQMKCKWFIRVRKELDHKELNIGSETNPNPLKCLANCTRNLACGGVQYYKGNNSCFYKSKVPMQLVEEAVANRVLYTRECVKDV